MDSCISGYPRDLEFGVQLSFCHQSCSASSSNIILKCFQKNYFPLFCVSYPDLLVIVIIYLYYPELKVVELGLGKSEIDGMNFHVSSSSDMLGMMSFVRLLRTYYM